MNPLSAGGDHAVSRRWTQGGRRCRSADAPARPPWPSFAETWPMPHRSGPVMLLPRLRRGRSTVRWIENLTPIAIVMHDPCSGFRLLALVLGLIVSLASAVGAAPAVPAYTITELGTFGGTSSEASRVGAVVRRWTGCVMIVVHPSERLLRCPFADPL